MSNIGAHRRRWWTVGATVLVAVAAFLALPALLPTSQPAGPARDGTGSAGRAAAERPTWDQVLALRDDLAATAASADAEYPVDAATLATIPSAPGEYTPLGRIRIADVGLDVEYAAGVHPSVLERGPGHWPGTALPGQVGNAVVSGHRTTFTSPFGDLDLLDPGDTIAVDDTEFRVTGTTVVPESEYVEFVLRPPADPAARQLTLFACEPKGDRTHRIVVQALATEGV